MVDGDRARAHALAATLVRRGYRAEVTHSAPAALAQLRATAFAALYVTQHLSTSSGPDLLAALERTAPRRDAPAIVFGVDDESSVLARAVRAGGIATVVSRRPPEEVAAAVTRSVLESARERIAEQRDETRHLRARSRANIARASELVADARAAATASRRLRQLLDAAVRRYRA